MDIEITILVGKRTHKRPGEIKWEKWPMRRTVLVSFLADEAAAADEATGAVKRELKRMLAERAKK